jgi:hypothetical protein
MKSIWWSQAFSHNFIVKHLFFNRIHFCDQNPIQCLFSLCSRGVTSFCFDIGEHQSSSAWEFFLLTKHTYKLVLYIFIMLGFGASSRGWGIFVTPKYKTWKRQLLTNNLSYTRKKRASEYCSDCIGFQQPTQKKPYKNWMCCNEYLREDTY